MLLQYPRKLECLGHILFGDHGEEVDLVLVVGGQVLKRAPVVLDDLIRVMCGSHDEASRLRRAAESKGKDRDDGNGSGQR